MTKNYLQKIFNSYSYGDAREESYYSHLSDLLSDYSYKKRKKKIDITILPKKTEAGNPDFRVWDGKQKITGYIEAKDLGYDLDKVEESEQLKRYLNTFPNVILTNFTEFRLYQDGNLLRKVSIAQSFVFKKLNTVPPVQNEISFFELLNNFLDFNLPKTYSAKTLAIELAKRTKFLKDDVVLEELKAETVAIHGFYDAFKEFLIAGISIDEFADLYSQTITYGLFAARLRAGVEFTRKIAYSFIPKSIGILRDIFNYISLEEIPPQMEVIIDDIVEVLLVTDVKKILDQYYHGGKGTDPILHFYETFLAYYDPKTREQRGVYYTPEPVITFITKSLNKAIKNEFHFEEGFASKEITLLDPAGGTLGFLTKAIETAVDEFTKKYGQGAVENFIKEQVLNNFYSFELMMAPYAIGHIKISYLLEELGYKMKDDERIKYYLTNTLDMKTLNISKYPGMASLSKESQKAEKIKKHEPILVILGNPPYSGHSSNKGEWITKEIKEYYMVDGKELGEKNPKWLQDDYVKFIRFAQWKIDQAKEGVMGYITSHSFLTNPTFRGMRQSLMKSFDEMYILDLHGNIKKNEKTPTGNKDENVFDIQQGVSISLFFKYKIKREKKIYHYEIFGDRDSKYKWLLENDYKSVAWQLIKPKSGYYILKPKSIEKGEKYSKFTKITELFLASSVGIVTARDTLTIAWTKDEIWKRTQQFAKMDPEQARIAYGLGNDTRDWKVKLAQVDIEKSGLNKNLIKTILYRPFDIRYTYYTGNSRGFHCMPRGEIMKQMCTNNIGLIIARQLDNTGVLSAFVTDTIIDAHVTTKTVSISYLLPLFVNNNLANNDLFSEGNKEFYSPNIKSDVLALFKNNFGNNVSPKEIFYYIYAILYSNIYRERYNEFLQIDFPHIPITNNSICFYKFVNYGEALVDFHLLKTAKFGTIITKFPMSGGNKVEKLKYVENKVWINETQYFTEVNEDVWSYKIGGYKVCEKWLKDRKNRILSLEDIQNYCKIITSIYNTIELQLKIDECYEELENNLMNC